MKNPQNAREIKVRMPGKLKKNNLCEIFLKDGKIKIGMVIWQRIENKTLSPGFYNHKPR